MKTCFFAIPIFFAFNLNAQTELSGQVRSASGEPVPFALVSVVNSQLQTIADENGMYRFLRLQPGKNVLHVKSIGYLEKTDTIDAAQGKHDVLLTESSRGFDEVVVNASRVDKGSGMAFSNLDGETLKKQNLGQDAPFMLNQLPSVVVNSDAGNGIGYTGIRIRGTDGTRINVTINGVPVNDAESQGTFFVDMPDLVSSVNNIQVQRGVGTSANGVGAFGATINFQTNELNAKPYANLISSAGSFNTFRNTIAAGSGLMGGKFTIDARGSMISSDGYVDRASADMRAYYVAAGYYGKKSVVRLINFRGWEKTYQAWNLVPEDSIKKGRRTYNENGLYYDDLGNVKSYANQTDNYDQDNYQLHFIHRVNSRLHFNVTGHYTKGKGYYEEYRAGSNFSEYGLEPLISGKDTITGSDLVRRKWLNNDFAGGIFNTRYTASHQLSFTLGGGYSTYFGRHFGNVVWREEGPDPQNHRYYKNTANKNDGNLYLKTNYSPVRDLNVFLDLQGRNVSHSFLGFSDSLGNQAMQTMPYFFFNPKAGISYDLNQHLNVYASVARANKEPNRNDFIQSTPRSRPKPEELTDLEAGLRFSAAKVSAGINIFNMQYDNQLVLNGQINDVGEYNRVNVDKSYRRGVELEAAFRSRWADIGGNLTLSDNRIISYKEFVDSFSVDYSVYTQYEKEYSNTHIAFSPSVVASGILTVKPLKNLELSFINKYVSRQFLDNTSVEKRSISPFYVLDLRMNYRIKLKFIPEINLMFAVYNALDARYETNGYTFSYYEGQELRTFNYLAPAAPVNFLGGINIRF
jgi:iron complex outermembrane recepter protein